MERNVIIAAIAAGVVSITVVYQGYRINSLEYRLYALESSAVDERADEEDRRREDRANAERVQPVPKPRPRPETKGDVKERLKELKQLSQDDKRERWKELRKEQVVDDVMDFAADNNIPDRVAEDLVVMIEIHSEDSRLRWERVHDGSLDAQDARQETDSARKALRDEVIDQIGLEKWQALEGLLDLGKGQARRR